LPRVTKESLNPCFQEEVFHSGVWHQSAQDAQQSNIQCCTS
jgi:hypothetical protein